MENIPASMKLEIIIETLAGALAAQAGGATQLDFTSASSEGGLTPSAGMMEQVCGSVEIDVLVMIRPHARGFVYSKSDIAAMCSDIRLARKMGAKGFLLGCLTDDRRVDVDAMRLLQDAAADCSLHFHLAWELTSDPSEALETIIELGVQSVRTTGGAGLSCKAVDGLAQIRRFVEQGAGRIDFFLASGVNAENIAQIVAGTGVSNAHIGTGARVPPTAHGVVDEHRVRQLADALHRAVAALRSP